MAKHYYIGTIHERNCDYDYSTHIMFQLTVWQPDMLDKHETITADRLAGERLEEIASTWYDDYDDETEDEIPLKKNDSGWYEANGGEVWVRDGHMYPIQHDTYMDLKMQHAIVDFTDETKYR